MERTQVAIIGGGPAGMLLSHMLHLDGIDSVVRERQPRDHVLKRIRAGVLEHGTVKLLRDVGLGERMAREGHAHDGTWIAWENREPFLIDTKRHTGKQMWSFGQTAITEELYRVRARDGGRLIDDVGQVMLHELTGDRPWIGFEKDGEAQRLECEFVAGCDGFHGVSRGSLPGELLRTFERAYPFGWLGVMSETPPLGDIMYAQHRSGFALASQRNAMLSRYYIQCDLATKLEDWPDDRFWEELKRRFPPDRAQRSPRTHCAVVQMYEIRFCVETNAAAPHLQRHLVQPRSRKPGEAHINRPALHMQAVLRHTTCAAAQQSIGRRRSISTYDLVRLLAIHESPQVEQDIKHTRIDWVYFSGTKIAQ